MKPSPERPLDSPAFAPAPDVFRIVFTSAPRNSAVQPAPAYFIHLDGMSGSHRPPIYDSTDARRCRYGDWPAGRKTPAGTGAVGAGVDGASDRTSCWTAIPHTDGFHSHHQLPSQRARLMLLMGSVGVLFAVLLMWRHREPGRLWFVLFLWSALGFYSFSWWRIFTAALGLSYIAWKSPKNYVYYAVTGMLTPSFLICFPQASGRLPVHRRRHYSTDWGRFPIRISPVPRHLGRCWGACTPLAFCWFGRWNY